MDLLYDISHNYVNETLKVTKSMAGHLTCAALTMVSRFPQISRHSRNIHVEIISV